MSALLAQVMRTGLLGQQGLTVWLTGLSGAGKSTIGACLEQELIARHHLAYLLDADVQRAGLNRDLGFSRSDRAENVRRLGELCGVLAQSGTIVIAAAIAPYEEDRRLVRERHTELGCTFVEIHVDTSLDECMRRDPKGLYRRAIDGSLAQFTGISAPYEAPRAPELRVATAGCAPQASAALVLAELERRELIRGATPRVIHSLPLDALVRRKAEALRR
ncbi:adenylyl-sulfate kinase [Oxalobacteraceae bacterium]|nr:adenylyl-sulfate kinase [Oxalobacteraceae bacterium]